MTLRVLIADDQELARTGFRHILDAEEDLDVVATVADGAAAVEASARWRPDVVVMDVRMPRMDGIKATRRIVSGGDAPRVLMLTTFDLDEHVHAALEAGASGFLLKDVSAAGLADAVRVVAAGDALLAPTVTRRLLATFATRPAAAEAPRGWDELTAREREIFELVAKGLSNDEIASLLHLSRGTVKTHVSRLLLKLGARDRIQLVVLAYRSGLVER